ncbi:hypothetical protein PENANT_c003G05492 [Penicillium antarcticum]|uniref:Zn(2)-C6 fungal-type domain-containing protein n=1 Tax=Penicillium antarcticum TaxID=416450 RepID=A0A1V6QI32_9EURO|nr:hypothetical protein PENANT_c003G05492 [Penicillium antarcticum]
MAQKPRKLQRVSKACDFCNRRSIKCSQGEDPLGRCQNCTDFDVPCTFDRPVKRGGVKAGTRASDRDAQFVRASVDHDSATAATTATGGITPSSSTSRNSFIQSTSRDPWSAFNHSSSTAEGDKDDGALRNSWKAFAIACDRQINHLVQVYFEIVYPMYEGFLILLIDYIY